MRIFSAGSPHTGKHEELCRKLKVPKLYSVMSPAEKKRIEAYDKNEWGIPLLVDSGAHSFNKLTMERVGFGGKSELPPPREYFEQYLKFIGTQRFKPVTFVELDIYAILPIEEIDEQYRRVKALGGAIEYMRVYHKMLDNGTGEVLRKWVDEGQKYVGFGADALDIFGDLFRITKDKVKVHGFAMTRWDYITRFPFYSVDSTTALTTCIFGVTIDKGLTAIGKRRQIKDKRVDVVMDDRTRLEKALKSFKTTERTMTDLWASRGVIWDDDGR